MNYKLINQLSDIEEQKLAFYKVFKNKDPFGKMFHSNIDNRVILFPTNGYYLSQEQFNAFLYVVKQLGETLFYLTEIEGDCFFEEKIEEPTFFGHWELNIDISYEEYFSLKIILENALYSKSGEWGIMISHEDHAVLGGTKDFINLFKASYMHLNNDLKKFIAMWEYNQKQFNADVSWVPDFIDYFMK